MHALKSALITSEREKAFAASSVTRFLGWIQPRSCWRKLSTVWMRPTGLSLSQRCWRGSAAMSLCCSAAGCHSVPVPQEPHRLRSNVEPRHCKQTDAKAANEPKQPLRRSHRLAVRGLFRFRLHAHQEDERKFNFEWQRALRFGFPSSCDSPTRWQAGDAGSVCRTLDRRITCPDGTAKNEFPRVASSWSGYLSDGSEVTSLHRRRFCLEPFVWQFKQAARPGLGSWLLACLDGPSVRDQSRCGCRSLAERQNVAP